MRIKRNKYTFRNVIEVEEFLDGRYGAPGEKRAEKKKATPEEIARVNQWNKEKRARHRLRMYFEVNDYFFTLTYSKDNRPLKMKDAKRHFRKFYKFVGKEYKKRGYEFRWIRNIECTTSMNWHTHVVLNRIPDTDIIISRAWEYGKVKDKQLLYEKGEFRKLAQYLTKDEKSEGKYLEEGILDHKIMEASYSTSRNMPLPEPKTRRLKRWSKNPRAKKGWYINKETYFEGINKVTGFPYRHYEMIRIRREPLESRDTHRDRCPRASGKKRKVRSRSGVSDEKRSGSKGDC